MKIGARLDGLLLAALAVLLIAPLFRLEYLDNWPSIESTFIADARMLREHLPHPGWQPLWYMGTRFDYIYPPALRYGTALISLGAGVSTARAYHLYTGIFYVLGIIAVWWLVRTGSQSGRQAWLAGAATALVSPTAFLLKTVRQDNSDWVPQRLYVLMRYGEGPHMSALAVLPAALAASWLALQCKSRRWLAAAGTLCALVVSTNFYGATALAIFFPLLVWAFFATERNAGVLARAAAIPLLAWGLCAFWLTPSYVRITLLNLRTVAEPGNLASTAAGVVVLLLFGGASWVLARGRRENRWALFVWGAAVVMSFDVLGFFYAHLMIAGDTNRLVPELDLALTLALAGAAGWMWKRPSVGIAGWAVALLLLAPAVIYLRQPWKPFAASLDLHNQYVWQVTDWVARNLPGRRVLPAGTVRFWFDAWADNVQADGGSKQGLLNQELPTATWQVLQGTDGELARLWLQAMGTAAIIVGGPGSREFYVDYKAPEKFKVLPVLRDDGRNTIVYGVPRVYPGIGRVVDSGAMKAMPLIAGGADEAGLRRYLAEVERADRPEVQVVWRGYDEARVTAVLRNGESVLLQETFDPAWGARENGRALPVRMEPVMGYMTIEAGEGQHEIQMRFETPLENRVGQGIFVLAALVCVWLVRPAAPTNR